MVTVDPSFTSFHEKLTKVMAPRYAKPIMMPQTQKINVEISKIKQETFAKTIEKPKIVPKKICKPATKIEIPFTEKIKINHSFQLIIKITKYLNFLFEKIFGKIKKITFKETKINIVPLDKKVPVLNNNSIPPPPPPPLGKIPSFKIPLSNKEHLVRKTIRTEAFLKKQNSRDKNLMEDLTKKLNNLRLVHESEEIEDDFSINFLFEKASITINKGKAIITTDSSFINKSLIEVLTDSFSRFEKFIKRNEENTSISDQEWD